MKKIETRKWKDFCIGEVFCVNRPKTRSQALYDDGDIPFVASGNYNNGVVKWCNPKDGEPLDRKGCISVSPLDGSAFYQPKDFLGRGGAGSAILLLRNKDLTEMSGLFVATVLRSSLTKFSYKDQINSNTILAQKIRLPVTIKGNPDFAYMNSFMERFIKDAGRNLCVMTKAKLATKEKSHNVQFRNSIDISKWHYYHLYDENLFSIDSGTKLDKVKMTHFNPSVNFVGRANTNNGVTDFIDIIPSLKPYDAGLLTISLGGEYLGSCFVQDKPFYTSQNVNVLIPRHKMSFYTKLFISTVIFREGRLHYKAFVDELNRHMKRDFAIPLPSLPNGSPDFEYMDCYIKDRMNSVTSFLSMLEEIE